MVDSAVGQTVNTRTDAILGFAATLRQVREAAGNPSFREMSGRSRIISHTTLHEAAQGNRLPSWATTVEFCKACDADPADHRESWERANRIVTAAVPRATTPPRVLPAERRTVRVTISDPEPAAAPAGDEAPATPATPGATPVAPTAPRRRRGWYLAAAAAVLVAAAATPVALAAGGDGPAPAPAAPAQFTSADCPVRQSNPPPAPSRHPGDHGAFISDITLPDCSHVAHGSTVVKVWRFKNTGTVPWTGYALHRIDLPQRRDQCQTITDIPVADTAPGALVDIRTAVTAPEYSGFCFVRFRMIDANGELAFPGGRPVNFQLIVD